MKSLFSIYFEKKDKEEAKKMGRVLGLDFSNFVRLCVSEKIIQMKKNKEGESN